MAFWSRSGLPVVKVTLHQVTWCDKHGHAPVLREGKWTCAHCAHLHR
jgi:hypothetical protein